MEWICLSIAGAALFVISLIKFLEPVEYNSPLEKFIVDTSKPPIPPPLVIIRHGIFGAGETRKSKERTKQWDYYINKYGYELRKTD